MLIFNADRVTEPLHCVVPVFNPWRHKSRIKLTQRALKHFHDAGVVITLVEIGFNRRELVFADSGLDGTLAECAVLGEIGHDYRHKYIGLHTKDELWLKENAINIGVQSLPHNWEQVCWLDSDIHFVRPNWAGECIHKLQHYKFLQMFSDAQDLGPNYSMLPETYPHSVGLGFVEAWQRGHLKTTVTPEIAADLAAIGGDLRQLEKDFAKLETDLGFNYPGSVFPGLAWACTRQAWEDVGGLIDIAIWGGADHHIAHALIGDTKTMVWPDLHRNYQKVVWQWYYSARDKIRRNVGVMSGTLMHNWHGKKTQRGYAMKHKLLAELGFDPPRHLRRDHQGLWQLNDDGSEIFIQLRDNMRKIAASRDEDSTDTGWEPNQQGH